MQEVELAIVKRNFVCNKNRAKNMKMAKLGVKSFQFVPFWNKFTKKGDCNEKGSQKADG